MRFNLFKALFISVSFLCSVGTSDSNVYSPIGKRDPFRKKLKPDRRLASRDSGLFRFHLDQFELKAVRKGPEIHQILISDPEGNTYILSEGEQMGKSRAVVSRILEREVILTEESKNYLGKPTLNEKLLSLPEQDELKMAVEPQEGN